MFFVKSLLPATLSTRPFLGAPVSPTSAATPVRVPVRPVGADERHHVARHLLALDLSDRYLRFGYAASDEQVQRYVDGLDFKRDEVFGIYNRQLELIAVAHLAFAPNDVHKGCAEFGVSVSKPVRGRGYGARLFERAVINARNEGIGMLFIHALSENTAMLKIARNAGASVMRSGSESEAHLQLPLANFDSRMTEIVGDHFGEVDFRIKSGARQFRAFLASLQDVRRGVREARAKSAS